MTISAVIYPILSKLSNEENRSEFSKVISQSVTLLYY